MPKRCIAHLSHQTHTQFHFHKLQSGNAPIVGVPSVRARKCEMNYIYTNIEKREEEKCASTHTQHTRTQRVSTNELTKNNNKIMYAIKRKTRQPHTHKLNIIANLTGPGRQHEKKKLFTQALYISSLYLIAATAAQLSSDATVSVSTVAPAPHIRIFVTFV